MNLHPQDCSKFDSKVSKSLCNLLSNKVIDNKELRTFTGLPQADILILNELSDKDLISVCSANKYLNDLCNNESFWLNKVLNKYSGKLGSGIDIKNKYMPEGTTWKEYYLWLNNFEEDFITLTYTLLTHNREDLKKLFDDYLDEPIVISDPGYFTFNNFDKNLLDFLTVKFTGITTRRMLGYLMWIYEIQNGQNINIKKDLLNSIVPKDKISDFHLSLMNSKAGYNRLKDEKNISIKFIINMM